jgi:UDP-glucose 4-epimerase
MNQLLRETIKLDHENMRVDPFKLDEIDAFLERRYRGVKAMVTGGLGFIGSNLTKRLIALGAEVIVVDSLETNTGGNRANLKGYEDRLEVRELDLNRCSEVPEMFAGVQVIFNLAGRVSHIDSMIDPLSDLAANVQAQVAVLESCRKLTPEASIVFASTRQLYGRPISLPVDESHPLQPVDVNGINKMTAEAYHTLYHRVYGLKTVSLRLTNTYGPGMRIHDARLTFLGIWLRRVIEGDAFEVWGGQQQRDLTYVDDAVNAFLLAGCCPGAAGQIFNIGGGAPVTLAELAALLIGIKGSGRYEVIEFPPERLPIDIGNYFADDSRFCDLTGWRRFTSLEAGLNKTLEFYQTRLKDYV